MRVPNRKVSERARAVIERFPPLRALIGRAQLWRWSRRAVCRGLAIGIFFGVLIPVGQIPAAAVVASLCRANIPAALASTLVTNPVTTVPLYYVAYQIGDAVNFGAMQELAESHGHTVVTSRIWNASRSLLIGIPVMASAGSVSTYLVVNLIWLLWIRIKRKSLLVRLNCALTKVSHQDSSESPTRVVAIEDATRQSGAMQEEERSNRPGSR